jgi:hypothetical protein
MTYIQRFESGQQNAVLIVNNKGYIIYKVNPIVCIRIGMIDIYYGLHAMEPVKIRSEYIDI